MHTMHLLPSVAIQPNLELKTRPKQLLGSLPLVIALPGNSNGRGKILNKVEEPSFSVVLTNRLRLMVVSVERKCMYEQVWNRQ